MITLVSCQTQVILHSFCFFQAEDGIRDLVRSRGLGDVYKRQQRAIGERDYPVAQGAARDLDAAAGVDLLQSVQRLSLIHI